MASPFFKRNETSMKNEEKIFNMLCKFDTLSSDDKKTIKAMCAEVGIKAKFETGCQSCYTDALLQLKQHYGVKSPVWEDAPKVTVSGHYKMNVPPCDWGRPGYGVVHLSLETPDSVIEEVIKYHPHIYSSIKKEKKS